ncbi:hypothetical protein [Brevibacillus porteri]|uniref:Lipoprotein n=1 Tax=Brevibacillus porteri TaxID=2126350 RepID=A0ABX5FVD2_9BACL|nr:hypothetical protein [Brevibacillus porteri]MED1798884.1 hypothetical protein [Brevibacillus porteri]MED2130208.1 hypothetical protein [Brevibacillus porteri]MED2746434.1 hypothetical protein [Brevibacillus porteri]MED2814727.1 hypothetical protein [Brevibacillus porteri]MED2894436.1 hypothetical protein [Brevibacillus porteri]
MRQVLILLVFLLLTGCSNVSDTEKSLVEVFGESTSGIKDKLTNTSDWYQNSQSFPNLKASSKWFERDEGNGFKTYFTFSEDSTHAFGLVVNKKENKLVQVLVMSVLDPKFNENASEKAFASAQMITTAAGWTLDEANEKIKQITETSIEKDTDQVSHNGFVLKRESRRVEQMVFYSIRLENEEVPVEFMRVLTNT